MRPALAAGVRIIAQPDFVGDGEESGARKGLPGRWNLRRPCGMVQRPWPGAHALSVTLADIEAARRVIDGAGAAHADAAGAEAVGADRRRGVRQIRKSPGHQFVQGSRRAGEAGLAQRGRTQARRHRHVGRQSCAGSGLSRGAARHSGDHRDAGDNAVREDRGDALARRRGGAGRRNRCRSAGALRGDSGASAASCWCILTTTRAIIAGQGTIALEMLEDVPDLDVLVIPDRRRRADRRQCHRGARRSIRRSKSSARKPHFIRRCGMRCTASNRPLGGPTLAEGIAVKNVGKLTLPIIRELVAEIILVGEAAARTRGQRLPDAAEDHGGRAPAPPALPPC